MSAVVVKPGDYAHKVRRKRLVEVHIPGRLNQGCKRSPGRENKGSEGACAVARGAERKRKTKIESAVLIHGYLWAKFKIV